MFMYRKCLKSNKNKIIHASMQFNIFSLKNPRIFIYYSELYLQQHEE